MLAVFALCGDAATLRAADTLLVGSTFGDFIAEYDLTTGNFIRKLVPDASGGLEEPNGMVIGPDGALYVSSFWTHNVLRYNVNTGSFLGVFASGFGNPTGLSYADGSFYMPDRDDQRVYRLDAAGAVTGQTPVLDNSIVWWPWDARLNGHGKLLMANFERKNILAYNQQSLAYEGVFAQFPASNRAGHMVMGPDGNCTSPATTRMSTVSMARPGPTWAAS